MHPEVRKSLAVIFAIMIVVFGGMVVYYSGIKMDALAGIFLSIAFGSVAPIIFWGFRKQEDEKSKEQHALLRNERPEFASLIRGAKTLYMLSTSSRYKPSEDKIDFVKELNKGMKATILILNPDSVLKATKEFPNPEDRKQSIRNAVQDLCSWKSELKHPENLNILLYDREVNYSIIAVDPDSPELAKAVIQIEFQDLATRDRPADIRNKRDDPAQFKKYLELYNEVRNSSLADACAAAKGWS